jgi:biofilm PGA synthesis lipoprotein PgaB
MRWLTILLLLIAGAALVFPVKAQPAGQRFVSIAFHDVADRADELDTDGVTTRTLAQFFDWLKGSGWTAVSLDDLAAAARGTRPLPDKAILLTFDDGYRSLYTRVFPLLQVYRFPVVAALVGSWMEGRPDGTVLYGDRVVPRSRFLSWSEAREMQASGLVEFASHSYDLHRGVLANPQGNLIPAAIKPHSCRPAALATADRQPARPVAARYRLALWPLLRACTRGGKGGGFLVWAHTRA